MGRWVDEGVNLEKEINIVQETECNRHLRN